MSFSVEAFLSITFVLRAVLCAVRIKLQKQIIFLKSFALLYDQIIFPRTFSTSIEMPESGYNRRALGFIFNNHQAIGLYLLQSLHEPVNQDYCHIQLSSEYGLHFNCVHWLYMMTILGCNEVKWNDSFEFSLNYTKLETLALKTYLGKSKKMTSWRCFTCWFIKLWHCKMMSLVNKSADWPPNYHKILIFSPPKSLKRLSTARIDELADSNEPAIKLAEKLPPAGIETGSLGIWGLLWCTLMPIWLR